MPRAFAAKRSSSSIYVYSHLRALPSVIVAHLRSQKFSTPKESQECLPAAPRAQFLYGLVDLLIPAARVVLVVDSHCSLLKPIYSWSRLEISEACMLRILTQSQASSEIFKYLQAFGRKDYAQDEGFSGSNTFVTRDVAGLPESIGRC